MGALEALSRGRLPPAGEPVLLAKREADAGFLRDCFAPYQSRFFHSGTAALAAAVQAAIARAGRARPEVLVPAYACPNVVSAVLHAGARPRLVDLEADRPWMQARAIEDSIGSASVALVAVDLFGIAERHAMLASLAADAGLTLIQDSAQAFPRPRERSWRGDLVVLSFGRGKPVSLLGGGAVLYRDPAFAPLLSSPPDEASPAAGTLFQAQARLYNALRRPALYWLPAALPLLRLGETRFTPLARVAGAQSHRLRHLPANIEDYWQRDDAPQRLVANLAASLDPAAVLDLPGACCPGLLPRLSRYPLLIRDAALRDTLYANLHRAGLGASTMYNTTLPRVPGLEALRAQGRYAHAEAFARRLLTLPVHSGVTPLHVERMRHHFARLRLTLR